MKKIKFKYRDKYNYPNWSTQKCVVTSLQECRELYGLGIDCEYEIISEEEIGEHSKTETH